MRWWFTVAIIVLGCGGGEHPTSATTPTGQWSAPAMLTHVPIDTPYLIAVLEPPTPAVQRRLYGQLPARFASIVERARARRAAGEHAPWIGAVLELAAIWQGGDPARWLESVGLDPGARAVFYGIGVWPVLRIGIRDSRKLRAVITRIAGAAGVPLIEKTIAGHPVWTFGEKATVVAAVLDREAVIAVVPTHMLEAAVHHVFDPLPAGTRLADSRVVPDLLVRYGFLSTVLGYVDTKRMLGAIVDPGPFAIRELGEPLRGRGCPADLARVVGFAPRAAFGYHKIDDAGFTASFVVETAPWFARALERLHTVVPPVPLTGQALLALGGAVDLDAALELMHQLAADERLHPLLCAPLVELDRAIAQLDTVAPLPPLARGIRGFGLVIENATSSPPSGTGQLVVVGTQVTSAVAQLLATLPLRVSPTADGTPIEIPLDWLGVPAMKSAYLAMQGDRLAIAVGPDGQRRVASALAAPASPHTPLISLSYDLPRVRKQLPEVLEDDPDLADLGNAAMTLDVRDEGIVVDVTGTWGASPQLIPSTDGR